MKAGDKEDPDEIVRVLLEHRGEIIDRWCWLLRCARPSAAGGPPRPALIDEMPELLVRMARCLEDPHSPDLQQEHEESSRRHALERVDPQLDLDRMILEYSLLREALIEVCQRHAPHLTPTDLRPFHRLLDRTLARDTVLTFGARERLLLALDLISRVALEAPDEDSLIRALLEVMVSSSRSVHTVSVLLLEGDRLRVKAAHGLEEEVGFALPMGEGIAGRIATTRRPVFIPDASRDPRLRSKAFRKQGIRAFYGLPLLWGDKLLGVSHIGSRDASHFPSEDIWLFHAVAGRFAEAVGHSLVARRERLEFAIADAFSRASVWDEILPALMAALGENTGWAVGLYWKASTNPSRLIREHLWVAPHRESCILAPFPQVEELGSGEDLPGIAWRSGSASWTSHASDHSGFRARSGIDPALRARFAVPIRGRRLEGVIEFLDESLRFPGEMLTTLGHDIARQLSERVRRVEAEMDVREEGEFRERLIAILGHDLRSPLYSLRSYARALAGPTVDARLAQEAPGAVLRLTGQMERMVHDLLEYARGCREAAIPINASPVDPGSLTHQVIEDLRAHYPGRRIELRVILPGPCRLDGDRILQVLVNLLENALRYSPPDTPVGLTVEKVGDELVLAISNEGDPIPPDEQRRLFQAFQRGTAQQQKSGLGLGLHIVDRIVRAHQGRVEVQSTTSGATIFRVRLPWIGV